MPPADPRAESLHNQGIDALRSKNLSTAIELISQAIVIDPNIARYHVNRGEAYRQSNRLDLAIADFTHAARLDPNNATAHYNLGLALRGANRLDESIDSYRAATRIKPDYLKAHYNLANALRARGDLDDAENSYRAATAVDPRHAESWNNLGELLSERMRIDDAMSAFDRVLTIKPDHAGAKYNRGFLQLLLGDYRNGFANYEHRWKVPELAPMGPPNFPQPMWDGADLAGKTILLQGEQGAGDSIQFARYAPLIALRGAKAVILRVARPVAGLLATVPSVARVVTYDDPLPDFDTHIPMLSAPRVFGTTLETVPADVPYVSADPVKISSWRQRIAPHRAKLNIGLAWAGNPNQANDRNRSAKLALLKPLACLADATIFSLQKGPACDQIAGCGFDLIDLGGDFADFSDTAAAIANLDVVVSVCTSVAHVAGAMAKPTLTMLCHNADWRWLIARDRSPWYPTMKLFRQSTPGDWRSVADRVAEELKQILYHGLPARA